MNKFVSIKCQLINRRQLVGVLVTVLLAVPALAQPLPLFDQIRANYVASDALLLDRHGEPLADMRLDPKVRRLDWVSLTALPPAMREALLAAEDKRFFEHPGVDWKAFVGAAWQNLWGHTQRGASTLTMQLAGLLEPTLRLPPQPGGRRNLEQKWDQSVAALELEHHWSKPQILEAYLNLAPFRGDLQGLEAASQLLFDMPSASLTRKESVILAALLRGPNARPALVARRACALASKLGSTHMCPEITKLAQTRLDAPRNRPRYLLAPHLARALLHQPGQRIVTTLDAGYQRSALQAMQRLSGMDSSVLVVDNTSGEALVWAGGANAAQADGIFVRRGIPDWWWPYAAELMLEKQSMTAASLLDDPLSVANQSDAAQLPNRYSLRTVATQRIPGAMHQLLIDLGPDALGERLRVLDLEPPVAIDAPDAAGDASLAQLAAAWHALASGGNYLPLRAVHADGGARKVLRPEASFILLDMLSMQSSLGWSAQWSSVAPDEHQAVVVGSTDRYTIAVAVSSVAAGVSAGKSNESAKPAAQQLWRDTMAALQTEPSHAPATPDGVVSNVVVFDPPLEPARREWFIKGTDTDTESYKRF